MPLQSLLYLLSLELLNCSKFVYKNLFHVGADDVIPIDYDNEDAPNEQQILFKELSIRKEYDFIYFTTETEYDKEFIRSFLTPHGLIIDTVEPILKTDRSILSQFFYSVSALNRIINFWDFHLFRFSDLREIENN